MIGVGVLAGAGALVWDLVLAEEPSEALADVRHLMATQQTAAALHVFAQIPPSGISDPAARLVLDQLYAGLCDPVTEEPKPSIAAADIRRIASRLQEVLRDSPNSSSQDHRRVGEFALAAGLDNVAVAELNRARSPGIDRDSVLVPFALSLLRADKRDELLASVNPADGLAPHQRALLWSLRARAQSDLGQFAAARQSLASALKEEPANLSALSRLGMLELAHGDRQIAGQMLDRARAIDPEAPPTLRLAAEYTFATGDYHASEAAYAKLVKLGVDEVYDPIPPTLGEARALIFAGDLRTAATRLNTAAVVLHDAWVTYYQAMLAYRAGDYRRAGELAEPLDAKLPAYPPLNLLMGAASLANGYPEIAVHRLQRYLDAEPGNNAARTLLDTAETGIAHPGEAKPVPNEQLLAAFGFPVTQPGGAEAPSGKF